jgi:hypothetical protein
MSKGASYKRYQRRWRRGEKEILRDGVVVAVCPEADRERATKRNSPSTGSWAAIGSRT